MSNIQRRIGLEQEFFIVNLDGTISNRADELLQRCHQLAQERERSPENFAPEFVKSMVEINTAPAYNVSELANEYFANLKLILEAAKALELRLYPLSQYPLHLSPVMRNETNYHIQTRTVGYERFIHAGRCIGTHLHLELPSKTIDSRVGISYSASPDSRAEAVNLYNLATALDAALIALSRACPFYEGKVFGMAARTLHYRGNKTFGWEGVYTDLPEVGGLRPYVDSVETLVEQQFERYYAWLSAMERAGVERELFLNSGGGLLKSGWNPVRLNTHGTVELRQADGDFPDTILALATLVYYAADRVRNESLSVRPAKGVCTFELREQQLLVPSFEFLNGELLYAAATEGVKHSKVAEYLDSVLHFVIETDNKDVSYLTKLSGAIGNYQTTEAQLLEQFSPTTTELSKEDGLRLVRDACDKLEAQSEQSQQPPLKVLETNLAE